MNTEDQPTGCGDTHSGSNATDGSLDNGIWREAIKARSYDVDFAKRARPEAICRWFLEAAWNHAEQLGVGYHELSRQNRL
ncbi:MAG TPA: hypothetical protein VL793_14595, partial [Patescibacteria group bacterium]|nr:hypothetical protein [Patescibacteria group bacterium]